MEEIKTIVIINKGKRTIKTSNGDLIPLKQVKLPEAEAKKLTWMYPLEVVLFDANASPVSREDDKKLAEEVNKLKAEAETLKKEKADKTEEVNKLKVEVEALKKKIK
ncbi:MAG: hypothetical protein LBT79_07465 [Elusimicrobiota bacterium]|jgi:hypothetical protein|nr:hypothetical protein [Elusimicrobiota bacterium]